MLKNQLATTSARLLLIKCVLIASVINNVSYPKILLSFKLNRKQWKVFVLHPKQTMAFPASVMESSNL